MKQGGQEGGDSSKREDGNGVVCSAHRGNNSLGGDISPEPGTFPGA